MSKIFKNLIPYWRWIILIFVFLIAQAYCDLALPAYTSDIIDVGIQDHGIEHILPEEITSEDYQMAQTFMLSDEKEKFTDCYEAQDASKSDDSVAKYKLTADSDTLDELDDELLVPLVMAYQAFQSGEQMDVDASAIPQSAALDDNMIKQIRSKVQDKIDAVGSATLKSMGVTFATKCDENAGIDVDANQVAYLWKAGAKMAAFAAIMLIAACVVGFAASKVGAAVGRDLREKTFSKVVGFSNAEINKFSTASLITRSTNDIQQIQMVTTMMLRMVLYAPIVGIGGIIKVAKTKSGMEWVIAIAVAAIMVFIFTLVGIAMPKFKIMQSLVDKVNLVSREILTGLSVIRAFGREKEEEKRFDEANRELTRTQLFTNRVMTFMMPGMSMIMYCITLGIVWVAAGRIDKGSMQVGTMTAFITYAMMIVMSFLMLSAMSIMLPRAGVAAERIDEVIKTNSTVNDPKEPVTEADHRGVIRFNHVDFRYPGAKEDVLSDIDFVAEPGKTTAIIGSTGCRKSTLVNLIPRLYDVTGGSITLDGKDIRRIVMNKSYRNTIEIASYANQLAGITEVELFERHGKPVEEKEFPGLIEALERVVKELKLEKQAVTEAEADRMKMADMETAGAEGQEEFSYETAAVITRTADEAREAYYILQKKLEAEGFDTKERLSLLHRDSTNFKKGLTVTTFYMAKGLEFDQVFSVFPGADRSPIVQRARYFAATRALHELYMYEITE